MPQSGYGRRTHRRSATPLAPPVAPRHPVTARRPQGGIHEARLGSGAEREQQRARGGHRDAECAAASCVGEPVGSAGLVRSRMGPFRGSQRPPLAGTDGRARHLCDEGPRRTSGSEPDASAMATSRRAGWAGCPPLVPHVAANTRRHEPHDYSCGRFDAASAVT